MVNRSAWLMELFLAGLTASIPSDSSTVIGDDSMRRNKYFMGISLGTPPVFNLVTIDTGSTLSWVQCQNCQIKCYDQAAKAGQIYNPYNSSTYSKVGCSTEACHGMHMDLGVDYGCVEENDACLYSLRYGSGEYSAGYLGKDRLTLASNSSSIDDFIFGCGEDNFYSGVNAGKFMKMISCALSAVPMNASQRIACAQPMGHTLKTASDFGSREETAVGMHLMLA
ncbi:hypothetical protein E2562_024528 [Oryza meyeriana var. granulata]|uniref:Peptidase A1 domain-containing protein n=1 Tax=Oryza meyeriana var. granulata TaxID=110450 RepID=A0A6G1BNB8_9ORYZ|nr:hypothetical protein E2562_024528 [Oryza meyeriana var. granulata]